MFAELIVGRAMKAKAAAVALLSEVCDGAPFAPGFEALRAEVLSVASVELRLRALCAEGKGARSVRAASGLVAGALALSAVLRDEQYGAGCAGILGRLELADDRCALRAAEDGWQSPLLFLGTGPKGGLGIRLALALPAADDGVTSLPVRQPPSEPFCCAGGILHLCRACR